LEQAEKTIKTIREKMNGSKRKGKNGLTQAGRLYPSIPMYVWGGLILYNTRNYVSLSKRASLKNNDKNRE
jgi:hypothetical protein